MSISTAIKGIKVKFCLSTNCSTRNLDYWTIVSACPSFGVHMSLSFLLRILSQIVSSSWSNPASHPSLSHCSLGLEKNSLQPWSKIIKKTHCSLGLKKKTHCSLRPSLPMFLIHVNFRLPVLQLPVLPPTDCHATSTMGSMTVWWNQQTSHQLSPHPLLPLSTSKCPLIASFFMNTNVPSVWDLSFGIHVILPLWCALLSSSNSLS